jgi:hypothetical protein
VYYSLEYDPSLSPISFSPVLINQLLRSAEAASRVRRVKRSAHA